MMPLTNVVAERSIISALYNYGAKAYYEISDILSADSLSLESNQTLYKIMEHLIKNDENIKLDIPTIYSAAKTLGLESLINSREERDHLIACISLEVHPDNTRKFAKKLKKLHLLRLLRRQLDSTSTMLLDFNGEEPIDDILSIAENSFLNFTSMLEDDNSPILMGKDVDGFIDDIVQGKNTHLGISTGYPKLNMILGGGIEGGTLTAICSRTGVGKSFLAANISLYIADKLNIPVLHVDTELEFTPQRFRVLAIMSGVNLDKIKHNQMNPREEKLVREAGRRLQEIPYYYKNVSDKPSFESHMSIVRRWVQSTVGFEPGTKKAKPSVLCYDYLKMLSDKSMHSNLSEYQVLGFNATQLANLSTTLDIPCITFVQLNRDGISSKEDLSTLSGSDRISWLCSNVLIFKRKSDEEQSEDGVHNGTHKMVLLKSRHGSEPEYGDFLNFTLDKKNRTGRIIELGLRSEMLENDSHDDGFITDNNDVPFV